jgi:hypothetical protein
MMYFLIFDKLFRFAPGSVHYFQQRRPALKCKFAGRAENAARKGRFREWKFTSSRTRKSMFVLATSYFRSGNERKII